MDARTEQAARERSASTATLVDVSKARKELSWRLDRDTGRKATQIPASRYQQHPAHQ